MTWSELLRAEAITYPSYMSVGHITRKSGFCSSDFLAELNHTYKFLAFFCGSEKPGKTKGRMAD